MWYLNRPVDRLKSFQSNSIALITSFWFVFSKGLTKASTRLSDRSPICASSLYCAVFVVQFSRFVAARRGNRHYTALRLPCQVLFSLFRKNFLPGHPEGRPPLSPTASQTLPHSSTVVNSFFRIFRQFSKYSQILPIPAKKRVFYIYIY